MKLAQLQQEFAKHIQDETHDSIFKSINISDIGKSQRLEVYRNNVFGNFKNALDLTYNITKKLVGEKYFQKLSNQYIKEYKSPSGNLDDYGQHFATLINSLNTEHRLPYLSDVAKLEWLYHKAYFAKDVKEIDIAKLQSLNEDMFLQIKFKLHPSCNLVKSKYPLYTIWNNIDKNSQEKIDISKKPGEFILIERAIFENNIHNLDRLEYLFLQNINKDLNLYLIYEILGEIDPKIDIGALINKFISIGVLSSFNTE